MKPIWWTINMGRGASALALVGAVLVSTPASAAPVFISGLVEARATAEVGGKPQVVDQQSQAIMSAPANAHLDVSAYAESLPSGQGTQVSARMLIDAAWDAADLGRVTIQQGFGGVANFTSGQAFVGVTSYGPPLWSYTFRADRDARLLFDYDVELDEVLGGPAYGGFSFLFDDLQRIDLTTGMQGTLDLALAAGQTYTIGLRNIIGGFNVRNTDRFSAGYEGLFQWSIEDLPPPAAVPEPAMLPLAAIGLCAAALARRRQRFASPPGPTVRRRDAVRG